MTTSSTPTDELTWEAVRARSASADGKLCCWDCYVMFECHGRACRKHMTDSEAQEHDRRTVEQLRALAGSENPIFTLTRRQKYARVSFDAAADHVDYTKVRK